MRNTQALIHLDRFRHNINIAHECAGSAKLCLALKADAYGHGALALAPVARAEGVYAFGVATAEEAFELRAAGDTGVILLYGIATESEYRTLVEQNVSLFSVSTSHVRQLSGIAKALGKQAKVWLKVDTGMGRIGCTPEEAPALAELIHNDHNLAFDGIITHLPDADSPETAWTSAQIKIFSDLVASLRAKGIHIGLASAANSPGLCRFPAARLDMVRPGIMAYGYNPGVKAGPGTLVKPVMEVVSVLSFTKRVPAGHSVSYGRRWQADKETVVGTIPLGYADGLPRAASGKLRFLVNGRVVPQVGTICMDQCMVNLGPHATDQVDSPVVVFGGLAPEDAASLGAASATISYEITCGISSRVPRVYL